MIDLIFIALLQAAAGEPAPAPAEAAAAQTETPAVDPDHVVRCRREAIVGTRLAQRICTTPAQDREMEEYARTEIQRGQSQLTVRQPPPQPGPMGN